MSLEEYRKFAEAQVGENFERPALLFQMTEATSKTGGVYMRFTLRDGVSEITALMFDTNAEAIAAAGVRAGEIVTVRLKVTSYRGSRSFGVCSIAPCNDPSVSLRDFVKMPPVETGQMFDEILAMIQSSADDLGGRYTPLSELTIQILRDHEQPFLNSSAAIAMHHAMRGGLIYHTYRMVKTASAILGVYASLDSELLLCGTALHDIGKIWEYKTSAIGSAEYTESGVLFGHLYLGASLIKKYADKGNYCPDKVKMLVHLLLSHHGTQEWGAVSCPACAEAYALHYLDHLDVMVYKCEEAADTLKPGELTDKKPYGLDNRIYKPDF